MAFRKPANQSTTVRGGPAANGNDGEKTTEHDGKRCTETQREASPWWQVDLLRHYAVKVVRVTTRGCCGKTLIIFCTGAISCAMPAIPERSKAVGTIATSTRTLVIAILLYGTKLPKRSFFYVLWHFCAEWRIGIKPRHNYTQISLFQIEFIKLVIDSLLIHQ